MADAKDTNVVKEFTKPKSSIHAQSVVWHTSAKSINLGRYILPSTNKSFDTQTPYDSAYYQF